MRTDALAVAVNVGEYRRLRDRLLFAYPELTEDEQTLVETLEGELPLQDQIIAIAESADADRVMIMGIEARIRELSERKARLEGRCERKRELAASAMEESGLKKIEAPAFTLSLRKNPPKVVIVDEAQVPETFKRTVTTVSVDKIALKEALAAGPVEGAAMSNGSTSLSVRVK